MSLHYNPSKAITLRQAKPTNSPLNAVSLTQANKQRICQIVNVFETGQKQGEYHALAVHADGKQGSQQISYGRSQVTEQGHLITLLKLYCDQQGRWGKQLQPYLQQIQRQPLHQDTHFKQYLIKAGKHDPIMRQCQDQLFDRYYWQPAYHWAKREGFKLALSQLVIYDSYIHSGHILAFLRKRFAATTPTQQGNEREWISQYTQTRHAWLSGHSNPLLRTSSYRTLCLQQLITQNNWHLDQLPITAHGVTIN
ncbi:chitosanase [Motilimonas cestriensis]|uniref:chitosanase n=1 Tax=Motilimonas cestriensis TaxID=2742685 RepID=UPI003DA46A17